MMVVLVLVLLAAAVFYLATSGAIIGPAEPPSGPEAWVVDERARRRPGSRS